MLILPGFFYFQPAIKTVLKTKKNYGRQILITYYLLQPRPCDLHASQSLRSKYIKQPRREVQICRLAPSAPIHDGRDDAHIFARLFPHARRPYLQSTQRIRVWVPADLDGVEDAPGYSNDRIRVCRDDAAGPETRAVVGAFAGLQRFV